MYDIVEVREKQVHTIHLALPDTRTLGSLSVVFGKLEQGSLSVTVLCLMLGMPFADIIVCPKEIGAPVNNFLLHGAGLKKEIGLG